MRRRAPVYASAALVVGAPFAASAAEPLRTGEYNAVADKTTLQCVSQGTAVVIDYGNKAAMGNIISESYVKKRPQEQHSFTQEKPLTSSFLLSMAA